MGKQDNNPVTRRDFLRAAALASAGMSVPSVPANSALSTPAAVPDRNAGDPAAVKRFPFPPPPGKRVEAHVHVNQVGYLSNEPKRAVIVATGPIPGNAFCIVDDDVTPQVYRRGPLTEYP